MMIECRTPQPAWLYAAIVLGACATTSGSTSASADTVTITATALEITNKTFRLRYEITNHYRGDVWICDSMAAGASWHFEANLDEDDGTLLLRRRLDVEAEGYPLALGLYVQLPAGETRRELMSFTLPVLPRRVTSGGRRSRPLRSATRLALEVGYYCGDLPAAIFDVLTGGNQVNSGTAHGERSEIERYLGGPLHFARLNEGARYGTGRVLIVYARQKLKGEKLARLTLENISIPYLEETEGPSALDLGSCTRMEIRFTASALEFFFPTDDEQGLLDLDERTALQATETFTLENSQLLESLVRDMKACGDDAFLLENATAKLLCYDGDKNIKSLVLDNDGSILAESGQVYRHRDLRGRGLPALRGITPKLRSIHLRMGCAGNLRDLCDRLRLYSAGENSSSRDAAVPRQTMYPNPAKWCDDVTAVFRETARRAVLVKRYVCPSAGEGKCHYAMNPQCQPDSPGDTVLLFETKAGWNQHGGPELFTGDNHEPRGGCVLLNDGTVKFVRTEEELGALRWR